MTTTLYTADHEWLRIEGDLATIGVTDYAQSQLGDVVFVELPEAGKKLEDGAEAAVVESVKAASEIYAPVAGEITESNSALAGDPAKVNADPEGGAWFFKMKLADPSTLQKLMTKDQYTEFVKGL